MSQDRNPRGRPLAATPETIEAAALRLWSAHGFQEVSIADVAAEVGVSARTIFRRYETKADIVWAPISQSFRLLGEALERTPPHDSVLARATSAVVTVIRSGDVDPTARHRIQIVGRTPELQSSSSAPFQAWRQSLFDFASAQPGVTPLRAHVLAHCVQATAVAGLVWWVTEEPGGAPWQAVEDAFARLIELQSP